MADENNDPIEIDDFEDPSAEPQPVPVPVPVPVPAAKAEVDESPISLVDMDESEDGESKVKAFGAGRTKLIKEVEFTRDMNLTGTGATRCKLFHSKISEGPMVHMQDLINEWIDHEGVEVKFITQSIGVLEGKRAEPNIIVLVWY